MVNVTLNRDKSEVTITLPYKAGDDASISASGKSLIRASTGGNQPVALDGQQVRVGVNIFQPVE
jgi:hypothetical protein